jgi:hypothetical protein
MLVCHITTMCLPRHPCKKKWIMFFFFFFFFSFSPSLSLSLPHSKIMGLPERQGMLDSINTFRLQ